MDDFEFDAEAALIHKVQRMMALRDRMNMQMELLYTIVEDSHQQQEGYYTLKLLNNLAFCAQGLGIDEAVQAMENMVATIDSQIARFDKAAQ